MSDDGKRALEVRTTDPGRRERPSSASTAASDPRDVALGLAVVGARAAVAAGRVALLPARVAIRMPLIRRAADRLAVEGMKTRRDAQTRLETVGDELLNGPTLDAVAGSLADHRVFERIARPTIDVLDVETAFAAALAEERTGRLVEQALESRLAADTTDRLLHGPELENAVEVIAASPAVRAALAQQTTSLAGEVAARVRSRALDLDDASERTARRWLRRAPRDEPAVSSGRVPYAGLVTRGAALALDAAIVNAIVLVVAALLGLITSLVGELRPEWLALTLAACGWALAVGTYFVLFWSTAGQTPAMRILRLRVLGDDGLPPRLGRSMLRLVGLVLAIVPLFAGFLPALFEHRRRALPDFFGGTVVLYTDEA